jgi:hypothetical protein
MPYIVVPFTVDADQLADDAIDLLVEAWDGWEPHDGDLEVIQIETLAPIAQDVAEVASIVPDAIFRSYGQDLLGVPYSQGLPAVGIARFTALDTIGHTSDAQIDINLGGVAFSTDAPVVVAAGQSYADVDITAREDGTVGNDLQGTADVMVGGLPWLSLAEVTAPTAGGADPEDDVAYQNRLADRLLLQSTTLVTSRDYELMAIAQEGIGRALASFSVARAVTVAVTDDVGEVVPTPIKNDLVEIYEGYRQVNTVFTVIDPSYTTISATFTIVVLPGYDPVALVDMAEAAVVEWLSPANWGVPHGSETSEQATFWLNETVVRISELERTVSLPGVRYVSSAKLNGGTADINLTGTAPLTRPAPGGIVGTAA